MSLKSDRWIRQMASDHGMIEPFEHDQIRHVKDRRVISYGTSSYGYDVRCAARFQGVHKHPFRRSSTRRHSTRSSFVDMQSDSLCDSAELVRARQNGRIFSDSRETC